MTHPKPDAPDERNPPIRSIIALTAGLWRAPYVLLTLAVLFWAGNIIVGRATIGIVPPIALAFWRWTFGLMLVLAIGWDHVRHDWPVLLRHWRIVVALGALGIAAFNTLAYIGLQTTTAVNALLLQSAMPILILVASFLIYGERPARRQVVGVLVSIVGVAVIASRGDWHALAALAINTGDAWVLLAVCSYALYSALLRNRPSVHPLSLLAATFAVGALILLPLFVYEHVAVAQVRPALASYLAIAYVSIFPAVVSYLCFNRGVELAGANTAGHFIHLAPIFGSVMAIVFLGETLHLYHLEGAALIAAGLMLALVRR